MKKLLSILLISFLLVSLAMLFACGEGNTPSTDTSKADASDSRASSTDSSSPQTDSSNTQTGSSTPDSTPSTDQPHKHSYEEEWSANETGHYKACTCHPDEIEVFSHVDTEVVDGKCDTCDYVMVTATEFTVTVVDDFGNPVKDVEVLFETETDTLTSVTGENGEAKVSLVYFDGLTVKIQAPNGYTPNEQVYTFGEEKSLNIVLEALVSYNIFVLDENEKGLPGITVSIMYPFGSYTTDENGLVSITMPKKDTNGGEQLFFIPKMPKEYELYDTQLNALIRIKENSTYKVHARLLEEYTVTATDDSGKNLRNAVFKFIKDGETVGEAVTDITGSATVVLPKGDYTVEISHLSLFYTAAESSASVTSENKVCSATFTENSETEMVLISLFYDDGTVVEPGKAQIYRFLPDGARDCYLLGVNSNSQAATFMNNEDCYFYALDDELNYGIAWYKKGDPTEIKLTVNKGAKAGSSRENPLLANVMLDLPFVKEDVAFNYEYQFEAGETQYLKIIRAKGKTFKINADLFTVEYNGEEAAPNDDGVISITFDDIEYGADAIIKVTAKETAVEDISLECIGNAENPYTVYSNKGEEQTVEVELFGQGHTIYFSIESLNNYKTSVTVTVDGVKTEIKYRDGQEMESFGSTVVEIIADGEGKATVTVTFTKEEQQ